jgi:hypothetical protein
MTRDLNNLLLAIPSKPPDLTAEPSSAAHPTAQARQTINFLSVTGHVAQHLCNVRR